MNMDRRFACVLTALAVLVFANVGWATTSVGRTPGHFEVSRRGSAQYSIQLWTPPGIRGIQPKLSLTYDSQLSYGLMGPGWMLTGLSAIARCNPTYAQDGTPAPITLTTADGLCLDGNRLRTTSGAVYQTEIANFSQVTAAGTAGNGPSYFTVQGKDGLTYEYGNTTDSKILPCSSCTTPYIWALDKVTDRLGNHMTFTYYQTGGAYVPLSIQYTAPTGSSTFPYQVNFTYTTKSSNDAISKSVAGSQVQQTNQLSTITVTESGTTLREYKLSYTTSSATLRATLTSIQECGGSGGIDCLAATTVAYQYGVAGAAAPATATGSGATNGAAIYSVDIDGDGKKDLVYAVTSGSNYQWWVQLATATGYGAPINTGAVTVGKTDFLLDDFDGVGGTEILAPVGSVFYVYKYNGSSFTQYPTGASVVAGGLYASADVDGDGRPDIVYVIPSTLTINVQLNTSSSSIYSFASPVQSALPAQGEPSNYIAFYGNNSLWNSPVTHFDFDADGREDLILVYGNAGGHGTAYHYVYGLLGRGNGPFAVGPSLYANSTGTPPNIEAVRWNDDACTDLIIELSVDISECNGSYATGVTLPSIPSLAIDWDGDGRTDALANVSGTWQLYRSEGNAVAPTVSTGIAVGTGTWSVTDKDGDGLSDFLFADSTTNYAIYYGIHNGASVQPDLSTSFTDGYGLSETVSYATLAAGTPPFYTKGLSQTFPYQDYDGPLNAVQSVVSSDGIGGSYSKTYTYNSAVMNLQGRGFQGFFTVKNQDSRTGFYDYQNYHTQFPYTGMLEYHIVDQSGPYTVQNVTYGWSVETLDSTPNNERYFPYYSSITDQAYEVQNGPPVGPMDGALITTTVKTFAAPDIYGNFSSIETDVTDSDSTSPNYNSVWKTKTTSTYAPDAATWCLNLPTEIDVTNTAPSSSITRHVSYISPDYTNCRETEQVVESGNSTYQVETKFSYDSSGNPNGQTVTGAGMTARTTGIYWGTSGQFPTTLTNELGQTTNVTFDPTTGQLLTVTDPNGLLTTWQYDDFARRSKEIRPDGTYTTWGYNDCATWGGSNGCLYGSHTLAISYFSYASNGVAQSSGTEWLDQLERPLFANRLNRAGTYDRSEVRYDNLGGIAQQAMPCAYSTPLTACPYWMTVTHDAIDRVTGTSRPISATNSNPVATAISYAGRTTKFTDEKTYVSTKVSFVTGALARSQDPTNYYQNFTYDAFGSLLTVTDSESSALFAATYDYGINAFQRSVTDMDLDRSTQTGQHRLYNYDALGEMTGYTDANSNSFSYTYDALSRPKTRVESDPSGAFTTTWNWGATAASFNIGKLASITAAGSVGTYSESYSYDNKARLTSKSLTLPGDATYTYTYLYNATTGYLDTLQYPVSTSSYQLKLQYAYVNGFLQSIADYNAPTTVFWKANTANPRGQITQETLGNGVITNRAFDAVTGWVGSILSGVGGGSSDQNLAWAYDLNGNVSQRQNNNVGLTENFNYDSDNRISTSTLNGTQNLSVTYDVNGNIINRSDVGSGTAWTYDPIRKHAVTQAGTGGYAYTYDYNGNATNRNGYALTWTSYNYPSGINSAGESVTFNYGPNRQRWKTVYTGSIGTETTYNAGKLLEKVGNAGVFDYRHYIFAGTTPVAIYSRTSSGTNTLHYLLRDHEQSYSSILTTTGVVDVKENFSAFGNRRNAATWSGPPLAADENAINAVSRQGYTGQTVLGVSMGLNHLNGRVQDAITGRFLSPDPFVPDPGNTQSFNRYSYAINNPLTRVDPSGFDDDGLDEVIVEAAPYIEEGASDIGSFFADLWHDIFGGGSPHLSAFQQKLSNAGLLNSQNLQGNPGLQSVDGISTVTVTAASTSPTSVTAVSEALPQVTVTAGRLDPNTDYSNFANTAEIHAILGEVMGINADDVRTNVVQSGLDELTVYAYKAYSGDFNFAGIGRSPDFSRNKWALNLSAVGVLGAANLMLGGAPAAEEVVGEGVGSAARAAQARYALTRTVQNNLASRPYLNSPLTIQEIESTGLGVTDPGGIPGALRYDVPGSFNGTPGSYSLVIDPNTNIIYHFLFTSGK